jgi:hypothetical protein
MKQPLRVLACLGALWLGGCVSLQAEHERSDSALLQAYRRCFAVFEAKHRRYPGQLEEMRDCDLSRVAKAPAFGTDSWKHPLRYASDGRGYVLLALGVNGHADIEDPWLVREGKVSTGIHAACRVSGNENDDLAITDKREAYRLCGY